MGSPMADHKHEIESQQPITNHVTINDIVEIKSDLKEIKIALMGNETIGHKGLFSRLANVERFLILFGAILILFGGDRVIKLVF